MLADDHEVVRGGLRTVIEAMPGWVVCGEASDGRSAVRMAEELKPDIVVMDMGMPELNGLDATRRIRKACPETEVLIFTGDTAEHLVQQVFEAGARSYVLKTEGQEHLDAALRALARHKPYFTTKVGEMLFVRFLEGKSGATTEEGEGRLTSREREVVQLVAEGRSNREMSAALGISVKTGETHRAAVMKKLKLKAFSELVRYAVRNRIISA